MLSQRLSGSIMKATKVSQTMPIKALMQGQTHPTVAIQLLVGAATRKHTTTHRVQCLALLSPSRTARRTDGQTTVLAGM